MDKEFELKILFSDMDVIVIDKPINLPVHKNDFMPHDAPYLTKLAGNIFNCWVYNVHRLDSKTSGAIILALSEENARNLAIQFEKREIRKKYFAIVLGNPGEGTYDRKVKIRKRSKFKKPAISHYKTVETVETDISYKDKKNIQLSLVEISPETGRWHQIRQHFAFHKHDIVGDSVHGDFTLNRIIEERTGFNRLFLHSAGIEFNHPANGSRLAVECQIPDSFEKLLASFT
jgi:tRNA pseudouridine65 synthase